MSKKKTPAKKNRKDLKAIAVAAQENASLDAERAAAPDGMTAPGATGAPSGSERAMSVIAKPPVPKRGKGQKAQASPTPPATCGGTVEATPAPESLAVVLAFDKKDRKWDAAIREGNTEHHIIETRFDNDDAARKAGEKWIASYAKTNDAARRKMLGWKATGATGSLAPSTPKPTGVPKPTRTKKASGLDAAAQVLRDVGEPMRCKEIVQKMLDKGLWATGGKTPHATIYAAILREIQTKGADARFMKTDRGLFTTSGK